MIIKIPEMVHQSFLVLLTLWGHNKILFSDIFYLIVELNSYLRYFSTNSIAL